MPFTPVHMGPGLLIKSVTKQYFSLMIFGFSQVAMDIEVLIHMFHRDQILHGFNHTYVGATIVALISIFVGPPICQFLLDRWIPAADSKFEKWIRGPQKISWIAAICAAFLGTYSHVFLDSIMHFDLSPWMPFSDDNAVLGWISVGNLHLFCIGSGILGGLVLLMWFYLTRRNTD
jgi:hypothetical protein